jgi:hypothetical protein
MLHLGQPAADFLAFVPIRLPCPAGVVDPANLCVRVDQHEFCTPVNNLVNHAVDVIRLDRTSPLGDLTKDMAAILVVDHPKNLGRTGEHRRRRGGQQCGNGQKHPHLFGMGLHGAIHCEHY